MSSRVTRIIRRTKAVWDECDYSQRRLLEIRTGIPFTPEGERALARAEVRELEAAFARPHPQEERTPRRSLERVA